DADLNKTTKHPLRILLITSCLANLWGLGACGSEAQHSNDVSRETHDEEPEAPPAKHTPTPGSGAELPPQAMNTRERLSRESDDLVVERLPNGMTKVDLRGRFQQAAVARIGSD